MTEPAADPAVDAAAVASAVARESNRLLREAEVRGLTLRLTGSLGVNLHCQGSRHLLALLARRPHRDIDLMGVWKQRDASRMFRGTRMPSRSRHQAGTAAGPRDQRAATLRRQIDEASKSRRWRLRARVGTRVRWYEEVQEVRR